MYRPHHSRPAPPWHAYGSVRASPAGPHQAHALCAQRLWHHLPLQCVLSRASLAVGGTQWALLGAAPSPSPTLVAADSHLHMHLGLGHRARSGHQDQTPMQAGGASSANPGESVWGWADRCGTHGQQPCQSHRTSGPTGMCLPVPNSQRHDNPQEANPDEWVERMHSIAP